ncbi:hypothetical protein HUG15_05630 [Salicibibacter cibarius]|uniref:Uncharacterized protein n=1 Tax=Salicibibacter cibarius TaxID=2743000 RepID=A0A7T7CAQ0_9BACI|nr:hypothetical protein [Salicibibacter cibarius]QQK75073.1 hypothetical protein HUG15_05295 [Salicibibacter cibarius]QQK75134.1 hypothetical protein HUG15_05630 [Salicibibacter cibarius]
MKDLKDDQKSGLVSTVNFISRVGYFFLVAFVLMKIWGWFVTPFGITELSYAHSLGLLFFFRLIKTKGTEVETLNMLGQFVGIGRGWKQEANLMNTLASIIVVLLFLGFGWIIQLFM